MLRGYIVEIPHRCAPRQRRPGETPRLDDRSRRRDPRDRAAAHGGRIRPGHPVTITRSPARAATAAAAWHLVPQRARTQAHHTRVSPRQTWR